MDQGAPQMCMTGAEPVLQAARLRLCCRIRINTQCAMCCNCAMCKSTFLNTHSLCWCNSKQQGWSPATLDLQTGLIVLLRHTCPPGANPIPASMRPCVASGKACAVFAFNFASADALQYITNSLCACLSREMPKPKYHVTAIRGPSRC